MHHFLLVKEKNRHAPHPLVFLPGWGFSADILHLTPEFEDQPLTWILPEGIIDPFTVAEDLQIFLQDNSITKVDLVGWSMGAYAVLEFANKFPNLTGRILLMAMRKAWPPHEIKNIRKELNNSPETCLRSFYRRCFLGCKAAHQKFSSHFEPRYLKTVDQARLNRGLDYLADVRLPIARNKELFLLHGGKDIIAPLHDMVDIEGARRTVLNQAGHALFLYKKFWRLVNPRQKNIIRNRFSKAAATYEQHATVQKIAAALLQEKLVDKPPVKTILEIGCGTGTYTRYLTNQWPNAWIVSLDFSPDMLAQARQKITGTAEVNFLCVDGEQFLVDLKRPFDLITSNACLQWFDDPSAAFDHMARLLSPDGFITCSIFGPRTLEELGMGLEAVLHRPVSLPAASFPNPEVIRHCLTNHFSEIECEEKIIHRQYESFLDFLRQLKNTGTTGLQTPPLLTPSRIRRLDRWFAERFDGYRLTYQIIIITAKKKPAN